MKMFWWSCPWVDLAMQDIVHNSAICVCDQRCQMSALGGVLVLALVRNVIYVHPSVLLGSVFGVRIMGVVFAWRPVGKWPHPRPWCNNYSNGLIGNRECNSTLQLFEQTHRTIIILQKQKHLDNAKVWAPCWQQWKQNQVKNWLNYTDQRSY